MFLKYKERFFSFYREKVGEKSVFKKRPLFITLALILVLSMVTNSFFSQERKKSIVAHTSKELLPSEKRPSKKPKVDEEMNALFEQKKRISRHKKKKRRRHGHNSLPIVHYRKKQLLVRKQINAVNIIPSGKKIIAQLLNSIDTRHSSTEVLAKVPFEVRFKKELAIPKRSRFIGVFSHVQGSERIFISFSKCIFPDGTEIPIHAQALDASDYRVGVKGLYHGQTSVRMAKSIAFGMISPMAHTLTKKEALGQGFVATPKATMKNALLQGVAQSSERESKRQIREIKGDRDYLTLPAGKEMIVNLLSSFKGNKK